jgi:hypothetical protein
VASNGIKLKFGVAGFFRKGIPNMQNTHAKLLIFVLVTSIFLFSACGGGSNEETSTPTPLNAEEIAANAISTFSIGLTQTALGLPSNTPIPTSTPMPTFPVGTNTPGSASSPVPTASCYRLVYIKDVTIPDNSPMRPGESFTKTWLVQNTGSCAWEVGFRFINIAGNPIGGVALTLSEEVAPNSQYELSVPMVLPTDATGLLTGTWRMADASDNYFGDVLTVVVQVSGTAPTMTTTATKETSTPTLTNTPSETPTP